MTVSVAYLGPEGTFSQVAALNYFKEDAVLYPQNTIEDVFKQVDTDQVVFGIVPIENSITGMIKDTVDCLEHYSLSVSDEISLPINFHFARITPDHKLEIIYAHPQALAQCKHWINANYPTMPQQEVASNGVAAKIAGKHPNSAAICGENAVQLYGLTVIHEYIEDNADNSTRFIVLKKQLGR